ncbi:MAG: hypothetical protein HRT35_21525 [Algicola sp.]|nr:hypothetical protein [Algicola sp.]
MRLFNITLFILSIMLIAGCQTTSTSTSTSTSATTTKAPISPPLDLKPPFLMQSKLLRLFEFKHASYGIKRTDEEILRDMPINLDRYKVYTRIIKKLPDSLRVMYKHNKYPKNYINFIFKNGFLEQIIFSDEQDGLRLTTNREKGSLRSGDGQGSGMDYLFMYWLSRLNYQFYDGKKNLENTHVRVVRKLGWRDRVIRSEIGPETFEWDFADTHERKGALRLYSDEYRNNKGQRRVRATRISIVWKNQSQWLSAGGEPQKIKPLAITYAPYVAPKKVTKPKKMYVIGWDPNNKDILLISGPHLCKHIRPYPLGMDGSFGEDGHYFWKKYKSRSISSDQLDYFKDQSRDWAKWQAGFGCTD